MTEQEKRDLAIEICEEALELKAGSEREGFVARRCGSDPELSAYVHEYVLAAHERTVADRRSDPLSSRRIGSYRLDEELGRGSMGIVYRAFDTAIGRTVAVKIIRSQQFSTADEEKELKLRFAREAAAAGRLSHPNIVVIHQRGEDAGVPYIVMEFVAGLSLEQTLSPNTPMERQRSLSILSQIAAALDFAHAEGVVHRDIKPGNILVHPDGKIKITDFGIARLISQTMTKVGVTMGTPAYMAPEQILASKVDGKADQFSLAVIAYQMLSGRKPFAADTGPALLHQIMKVDPPALNEVNSLLPSACSSVVFRALAKEPNLRYATCTEFVQELRGSLVERHSPQPAIPPAVAQSQDSFSIRTCEKCGVKNRVPERHATDTGRCASCKAALPPASVVSSIQEAVMAAKTVVDIPHKSSRRGTGFASRARSVAYWALAGAVMVLVFSLTIWGVFTVPSWVYGWVYGSPVSAEQKACDGGDAEACNRLGVDYEYGNEGAPYDLIRAIALFQKACDGGSGRACYELGSHYERGDGSLPQDAAQAAAFYKKACADGSVDGCTSGDSLGLRYEKGDGGLGKDLTQAVALYEKACDRGIADGCNNLGRLYEEGEDVSLGKDLFKAFTLYKKACDGLSKIQSPTQHRMNHQGNADGCFNLGRQYERGDGAAPKDLTHAVALYEEACDGDSSGACFLLALHYHTGYDGLPQNTKQAAGLFQKACDGGNVGGCFLLGTYYVTGQGGLPKDLTQAAALFEKDCNGGGADGCLYLATYYQTGQGVPKDLTQAAALYKKACDGGKSQGCSALRQLSHNH